MLSQNVSAKQVKQKQKCTQAQIEKCDGFVWNHKVYMCIEYTG